MLLQRARECHHGSMLLLIVFQQVEIGNTTFTARVPEGAAIGDKFSVKLPGMTTFMKISRCRSEIHVFLSPCACRPAENVLYNCVKSTSWYANCCAAAPNSGNLIYQADATPALCLRRLLLLSPSSLELTFLAPIVRFMCVRITPVEYRMRCKHATRFSFVPCSVYVGTLILPEIYPLRSPLCIRYFHRHANAVGVEVVTVT